MNKTAIKNFAVWARNKLIADITYKAGLLGITEKEVKSALPQSTKDVQFFDIGTKEPYSISGIEIKQRDKLAETIKNKAIQSDYETAYKAVVEEVAYTWFNRLIAVRFMEVNEYLPSRIRVLSSESANKTEPDMVTTPFDTGLDFTPYEKDRIVQLTHETKLDELFRMLFIKQCNALNAILPSLFEKTSDYTELLLNVSFTDSDGVVYHLVHDIKENDFRIRTHADEDAIKQGDLEEEDAPSGQVEIIGWLYQYYNTEPKDEVFALLKKNVKITKERIPAATQLFTPDWIVHYMVENSLGRLWLEGHPNDVLKSEWKYYLDEAEQEVDVQKQLEVIREEYKTIKPEDIKVIDPCMGSGHILVYAFDVLMQIYESCGYSQRDAAKSIVAHNIYGLDIDNRAYQLACFAVMMKARQYNRRILNGETDCHVYSIQESNGINRIQLRYFGTGMSEIERNTAILQMQGLLDTFNDAKEYGSILNVENYNWELLYRFVGNADMNGQMTLDTVGIEDTKERLRQLVEIGMTMAQKYDVVVTNPPYMGNMPIKMAEYVRKYYPVGKYDIYAVFMEKCVQLARQQRFISMITQQAWMFISSFKQLRFKLMQSSFVNMLHLGARAFDEISGEVVQTTSFVIRSAKVNDYQGVYSKLIDAISQTDKEKTFLSRDSCFISKQDKFGLVPGCIFAYWISSETLTLFSGKTLSDYTVIKSGIVTGNNDYFLKLWHEISLNHIGFKHLKFVDNSDIKWVPMNKGGGYRKHYGLHEYVMNLHDLWEPSKTNVSIRRGDTDYYFREGLTWSALANNLSVRMSPSGFVFDTTGSMCFVNEHANLPYFEALLNSCVTSYFMLFLSSALHFNQGSMEKIPVIICRESFSRIAELTRWNRKSVKDDWDSFETSWDFAKHPLLRNTRTLSEAFDQWKQFTEAQFNQVKANEEELNRIFIDIYGLQDELTPEVEDKDISIRKADLGRDIRSFVSYAVGCMFGRFSLVEESIVYAGGQWDDGKYSNYIPDKDNIIPITDEEYFEDDIVGLFIDFVKKTFGEETLEQNLDFIAKALGNKGNTSREIIRNYFVKDFFKDHCKVYQKRPIYWHFDSGKADGFKVLVYMHRYDENTIGNLRIDYLHRMQRLYDSEIARMQETIENSTNAREVTAAEKRKEKLTKQLKETKEYDEKIAHLALARISIDLDDGVVVNYEKVQTGTDGKKLEVLAKI